MTNTPKSKSTPHKPASAPVQKVSFVQPKAEVYSLSERCQKAGGVINAGNYVKKSVSTDKITLKVEFASNFDTVPAAYLPEIENLAAFM